MAVTITVHTGEDERNFWSMLNAQFYISNNELLPGMTIWVEDPRTNRLKKDVTLKELFITSPRFPELAFRTTAGNLVKFAQCGNSWVSYARA